MVYIEFFYSNLFYLLVVGVEGYCRCRGLLLLLITLSDTHTHTLGRTPWTRDWSFADAATCTRNNTHTKKTSLPPAGFETVIPAGKRPETHAIDRAAIRIGRKKYIEYLYFQML